MAIPKFNELMVPTLKVLEKLGGSGTNEEIAEGVIQLLSLSEDEASQLYDPAKSSRTIVEYRLAWARTYLKKACLIDNSGRGVWAFTEQYQRGAALNPNDILQTARGKNNTMAVQPDEENAETSSSEESWKESLHQTLLQLEPSAFERLSKRLLREIGFVQVEVTGKVGDGGIDGKGIVKIQDVLSYHIVFQCKRYTGSVGPGAIRDFRGAMIGRADKGLFITTGTFTREATKEATRDGAAPIDLIDGDDLIDMLKKLALGVTVKMVEEIEVDKNWFAKI